MRTKVVTLFEYDELPTDEAKEKARDWYREASAGDTFYAESVYEDFERICNLMGIDIARGRDDKPAIQWSGFYSQGDGACFAGQFNAAYAKWDEVGPYAPLDDEVNRIAAALAGYAKTYPELSATIVVGRYGSHYSHSGTMNADVEGGYDEATDEVREVPEEDALAVERLFRDLADWLYRQLENAYDAENEDESIIDNIRVNEYTFTESGKRED